METGHNTSKIMRVLNAFYEKMVEEYGKEPMSADEFKRRKQIINNQAKSSDEQEFCKRIVVTLL